MQGKCTIYTDLYNQFGKDYSQVSQITGSLK